MKIFFRRAKKIFDACEEKYLRCKKYFSRNRKICVAQIFPQVERHESEGNFIFKENEKGRDDRAPQFLRVRKKLFERKRKIIILSRQKIELLKLGKQLSQHAQFVWDNFPISKLSNPETQNVFTLSVESCNSQRDTIVRKWKRRCGGVLINFKNAQEKRVSTGLIAPADPGETYLDLTLTFGGVPKRAKKGQKTLFFTKCVFSCKLDFLWIFTSPGL